MNKIAGNGYANDDNVLMLIYLMKAHGIKKVIVSPGSCNLLFVNSIQYDPYFEIFSCVDERSAAYMACGIATDSGEPVALSCTGATASRNYLSALTESYYRNVPILAITSCNSISNYGQGIPQNIDRSIVPKDAVRMSVQIPISHTDNDRWGVNIKLNTALLELKRDGGGPVHINIETQYCTDFTIKELPETRIIRCIEEKDEFPLLKESKIAIFVGNHKKWDSGLIDEVEKFCENYNAAVVCDVSSNYPGKYKVNLNLINAQDCYRSDNLFIPLIIDMGDMSGAYLNIYGDKVWRIDKRGEIMDRFHAMTHIFKMGELVFFKKYNDAYTNNSGKVAVPYYQKCISEYNNTLKKIPTLPFSNAWIAMKTVKYLNFYDGNLFIGGSNTRRVWNFVNIPGNIHCMVNTGAFGIDGNLSTLIGASINNPDKMYIGIIGDLTFFYDMNSLGNRHIGNNLRVMIINNGGGAEFKMYTHLAQISNVDVEPYIGAFGHFGNKSKSLVADYAKNLGFIYYSATCKKEYLNILQDFFLSKVAERPIIFEIFIEAENENKALKLIRNCMGDL